MKNFARAIRLALSHRWSFAGSVVCALMVSVLWGANITTVYPFVEVALKGQSLQQWVDRSIDQSEQTIAQLEAELAAAPPDGAPHPPAADNAALHLEAERRLLARYQWLRPYIYRYLPDNPFQTLVLVTLALLVGTLIKGGFLWANMVLISRVTNRTAFLLRKQMYRCLLRMDLATFHRRNSAELMSHFSYDMDGLSQGLNSLLGRMVREPLKMVACLVGAAWICWRLLLLSLVVAPVAAVLIGRLGKLLKRAHRRAMEEMARFNAILEESFQGVKIVKAFTMERYERRRVHQNSKEFLRRVRRIMRYEALGSPLTESMGIATICLALLAGAYLVLHQETHLLGIRMTDRPLSISALLVFYGLLAGVSDPFRKLSDVFSRIQRAAAAADRIYGVIDRQPQIRDPQSPAPLPRHQRELVFQNVSFAYQPGDWVVRNFDLRIAHGETIALVGPNGCGKTTLANLLLRFYDVQEGAIAIDGTDIRQVRLRDLRRQIGLVSQEPTLFNDTVWANIRYGSPHATDEQVIEAAKRAHAHRFIEERLEHGYDTMVGPHGSKLSGGQRQRITLARAILRDPSILILDEATSQVDLESEQVIHRVLEQFIRDRTTLIITHRMSILALAHRIVVMNAGRILDVGTHEELVRRCDLYRRLHEIQYQETA